MRIRRLSPVECIDRGRFIGYLLSKKEGRTGSPEKPLSALGALGYKNYWTLSLMRYLSTASPGIRLGGKHRSSNHTLPELQYSLSNLDISTATSMTTEDICSVLMQQGMIQNKRDTTPFSPAMKPSPGQSIRFVRGRKNGTTRKHLQRKQTDDDFSRGPFVPPKDYEIVWDPEAVKTYLDKWNEKGYLTLKPEKLKWSPFILQRTTKPVTNAPLTTMDRGTEVKIVDVTVKKDEAGKLRSGLVVEERIRTPSVSTPRDDESSAGSSLHTQDQAMSPASTSRLKAQVERDRKLALKLANTSTPSTRRTRLRSRDASTPQVGHTPVPDTPTTRTRRANGVQGPNGTSGTSDVRSPSITSTVSRLRGREMRSRSGSAARSTITRSRSALKTPSIADHEDGDDEEGKGDDRDAEGDEDGDGDYIDVDIDVDEDEKLAMRLAEEEVKRVPMKRLRSRSGTASNYQSSDFFPQAHLEEDILASSGPGIKRSDSSRSLTRKKRMRIDSSPIMEDSLALPPEEDKHSPPAATLIVPAAVEPVDIPVNGFGINGAHSSPVSIKADSPPTLKMEGIPEADLDIVASLAALKNGGRFSGVPSIVKDQTATVVIVTPVHADTHSTNPNQISDQAFDNPDIEVINDHGFNGNPSDLLGPRMEEEEDEYGDLDAEGELDDEEGIDIVAVL